MLVKDIFPLFFSLYLLLSRNNFKTAYSFKMYVFADLRMWSCIHSPICLFVFYQLVLEAHNVPELSAGVNCTFEDLAEMKGLVEGNRIRCSSPAEKEMPRIIVDKGKGGSPVALLHKRNPLHVTYVLIQPPDNLKQCFCLKSHCADSRKMFVFFAISHSLGRGMLP